VTGGMMSLRYVLSHSLLSRAFSRPPFSSGVHFPPRLPLTGDGKRRLLCALLLLLVYAATSSTVFADCSAVTGTVRDFHDTHPDFESYIGDDRGIVLSDLGPDRKPVYAGQAGNPSTHGQEAFDQWYHDAPGVNLSQPLVLPLTEVSPGICGYSNGSFFPIDGQLFGNEGRSHNYHFTFQLHLSFVYNGGETFNFTGDDDLFLFLNNRLVIDLGGVHGAESASINLDGLAGTIGLTPGHTYNFDLFFAERHTVASSFALQTSIQLQTNCEVPNCDNLDPTITSVPRLAAEPEVQYEYDVDAVHPSGGMLVFSLPIAPAGMAIDSVSGLIHWTPSVSSLGVHPVEAKVRDQYGKFDTQSYYLTVTYNRPPVIASIPPDSIAGGGLYAYDVIASDPDDDNVSYELLNGPPSMAFVPGTNQLRWQTLYSDVGPHPVEIQVSDGRGGIVSQAYTLTVTEPGPDSSPPVVQLQIIAGGQELLGDEVPVTIGTTVEFRVTATDNVGVVERSLTVGGAAVPLDDQGHATMTMSQIGLYPVVASARDAAGNEGTASRNVPAYDPSDTHYPNVVIHSPENDSLLSRPTDVRVTIEDAVLESWRVDYARYDQIDPDHLDAPNAAWTPIANGTASVTNAVVGVFDPTILQNDPYIIRATGTNINGRTQIIGAVVGVYSQLKLGEFRIEFTDLSIPVAGVPIQIKRVYDSRQSHDSRDFGYGWSLGIQDAHILETTRSNGSFQTFYPGTRVYINTPDGRRVGFTAYTASLTCFGFCFATVGLRPDPGVHETLEIVGGNVAILMDGFYLGGLASDSFDPNNYKLTLKDGTVYEYSQSAGLIRVRDLSGNRLEFSPAGIHHYAAGQATPDQQVTFNRDEQGRIRSIVDPDGHPLSYVYDDAGDLRSFSDQVGNQSQYSYHTARPHYLETIIDPLGHQAIRTEFDDAGRVRSITDALGNAVTQTFDTEALTGTFTDANGNVTTSWYDERGNVVRTVDPEGGETVFTFDEANNQTSRRDPRGFLWQYQYDERGNQTTIIDPSGHQTVTTYSALNKPTAVQDVLGHVTQFGYDAQGNLLSVTNAAGRQSTYARDPQGRVTSVTDYNGHTTSFDYAGGCPCGQPGKVTNPDGTFKTYQYNDFGRVTHEVDEESHETVSTYDASGRLVSVRDGAGGTRSFAYEGPLKVSETDPLGRTTTFTYDADNRMILTTDPAGGLTRFEYDANGNRTAVIDPVTNRTEFVYDGLNRVTREIDPLGHATQNAYDRNGNLTEVIDRNGRRRTYDYDDLNRRTREQWWDNSGLVRTLEFSFNALGLMTEASDPASTLEFSYDNLNRLLSTTQSNVPGLPDFTLNYSYDDVGNVISVTDNYGVQVASTYDVRNRLAERRWQGGEIAGALVRFGYDGAGNKALVQRYSDVAGTNFVGQSTYEYNGANAMTHILHANAAGAALAEYDYARDAAQQILTRVLSSQTTNYAYDPTGQLIGADYSDDQPDESYSYDMNGNRTMPGYATGPGNRIQSDLPYNYEHDPEGNVVLRTETATGVTTSYVYDHRNRLINAVDHDGVGNITQAVEYIYDAGNHRIGKSVGGTTTHFRLNGENAWSELDQQASTSGRYLLGFGLDEMVCRYTPSRGVDWYLSDNLGTCLQIADENGNVVEQSRLEAFGRTIDMPTVPHDRFLFTGREADAETGLYYYRARYYIPGDGRFACEDPVGFMSGDLNLYRYVRNRPVSLSDPTGLSAEEEGLIMGFVQRSVSLLSRQPAVSLQWIEERLLQISLLQEPERSAMIKGLLIVADELPWIRPFILAVLGLGPLI
jgi:fibro-slime domain-containing protein/RHS repeat-associated protein